MDLVHRALTDIDRRVRDVGDQFLRCVLREELRNFELRVGVWSDLDANAEIERWSLERSGNQYAFRLLLIANTVGLSQLIVDECIRLVGSPGASESHALFLLAATVALHLEGSDGASSNDGFCRAVDYLRAEVDYWRRAARPEDALVVYELLSRIDGIGAHAEGLAEVRLIDGRLRAEKRLLGSEGSGPFEVLLRDCKTLLYWGLAINASPEQVLRELSLQEARRVEGTDGWPKEIPTVPPPLVSGPSGKRCVNREFLLAGSRLFSEPMRSNDEYDLDRAQLTRQPGLRCSGCCRPWWSLPHFQRRSEASSRRSACGFKRTFSRSSICRDRS